jgi:hypothetical protein
LTAFIGYIGQKWLKNLRNLSSIRNGFRNPMRRSLQSNYHNEESNPNPLDNTEKIYDDLHLIITQIKIRDENRQKAGIYKIYNKINGKYYIGSAITNRINVRFRNHMVASQSGNSNIKKAINKYGLINFKFIILEYYPGIILKENLKKNHILLLERENYWINLLNPPYNILKTAGPNNYTQMQSIEKKDNYSEIRK